jgi:DNA (cytosine-5)-methyltransferase 1
VGRVADGVPSRVDRLKGLGNAIVPQVAQLIGEQILSAHESQQKLHEL